MFYKGLDCLHLWILSPTEVLSPLTPALGELFELYPICANLFFLCKAVGMTRVPEGGCAVPSAFLVGTRGNSANGFISLKEHSSSFRISFYCVICV